MKMQMRRMFAGHCRGAAAGLPPPQYQCSALQLVFFYFISDLKTKDNFIELSDEFELEFSGSSKPEL